MKPLSFVALIWLSCAASAGDKKTETRFTPGPASSYSTKQTNDNVTIAAVPYVTDEQAHTAFGKLNPYEHGVLPVLVVIQNDSGQALRLQDMRVEYDGPDRSRVDPTPGTDVKYIGTAAKPPHINNGPIPGGIFKHKGPLDEWEIIGRAFTAKLVSPHDSASGFFYFQTRYIPGARLYITGIEQASTGKELIYFEIPLDR